MQENEPTAKGHILAFGPFRIFVAKRVLEKNGAPLNIGGRAFDILVTLAQRHQEVVSKRELFDRVWPDVNVDDSSLRFHINALRRVLGDGRADVRYVANVPGRGYYLAMPVSRLMDVQTPAQAGSVVSVKSELPPATPRIFGRNEALSTITALLEERRFVSIVGAGGIGKTTLAISVGHAMSETTYGEVYFADLASTSCPRLVPAAISAAMGLPTSVEDFLAPIVRLAAGQRALIIIDGCEHVVEAAASFSEAV